MAIVHRLDPPGEAARSTSPTAVPGADAGDTTEIGRYLWWSALCHGRQFDGYESLHAWSVGSPAAFWASIAEFYEVDLGPDTQWRVGPEPTGRGWFPGASLNLAGEVLERCGETALVEMTPHGGCVEMSRAQLRRRVARVAGGLQGLGVGPGDHVAGCLQNGTDAVVAFLASAAIGAVWAVVDSTDGAAGAVSRLHDWDPVVVVTDLDPARARALTAELPSRPVLVLTRTVPDAPELALADLGAGRSAVPVAVPFDHPVCAVLSGRHGAAALFGHGGVVLDQLRAHGLGLDLRGRSRLYLDTRTSSPDWYGLVCGMLTGATIVVASDPAGHLGFWELANRAEPTVAGGSVAAMRRGLHEIARTQQDLPFLDQLVVTDGALPKDEHLQVRESLHPDVLVNSASRGSTLIGPVLQGGPLQAERAGEIAGMALGAALTVVDEHDTPMVGGAGRVAIRSPHPALPLGVHVGGPGDHRLREPHGRTVMLGVRGLRTPDRTWAVSIPEVPAEGAL
ncbi:Acetyl-coenzyme A synthetase [Pseudonocardia autotrophica]|nr:Acetyl-coenzyme A synthetase [Pseudonocardia autotrophica]